MEVRPPNLPLNVERLKRLEPSAAVERLEQLELTDPHDEWSIAVERFERLEQPHPQWTASCPRLSRLCEQNRNFPSPKQMRRDESGSIQEGGNVKSKDATPSRSSSLPYILWLYVLLRAVVVYSAVIF